MNAKHRILALSLIVVVMLGCSASDSSSTEDGDGTGTTGGINGSTGGATTGGVNVTGGTPEIGTGGDVGTGGLETGGAGAGALQSGGLGGLETGGTATGGAGTGASQSGGLGGWETGGMAAGGGGAGGMQSGGLGGLETGGATAGGVATGGVTTGGAETGGTSTGGTPAGENSVLTAPWTHVESCSVDNREVCSDIPVEYRRPRIGGPDNVPTLTWTPGPTGTLSYALVFYDISADITHWALWNVPAGTTSYGSGNTPASANASSFDNPEWAGPGSCSNVYDLILYTLNVAEYMPDGDHDDVHTGLEGADADLVLSRDLVRGAPQEPCG